MLVASLLLLLSSQLDFVAATPADAVEMAAEHAHEQVTMREKSFVGLPLPAPGIQFVARPSPHESSGFAVELVAERGKRVLARRSYVFPVDQTSDLIVARRTIEPGQTISEYDLSVVRRAAPVSREAVATRVEDLLGKVAARRIAADRAIALRLVRDEYVVKRGEKVRVRVGSGLFEVMMTGEATANGSVGETISLINRVSGKSLRAKVIGPGLTEAEGT